MSGHCGALPPRFLLRNESEAVRLQTLREAIFRGPGQLVRVEVVDQPGLLQRSSLCLHSEAPLLLAPPFIGAARIVAVALPGTLH